MGKLAQAAGDMPLATEASEVMPPIVYPGDARPEAGKGLPPAGHMRDEELKQRLDVLERAAELMNDYVQAGGDVALSDIEPDREILQHIEQYADGSYMIAVRDKQEGYQYQWVPHLYPTTAPGLIVRQYQAMGYEVVKPKEHKESGGNKLLDKTFGEVWCVGDTILLRITAEKRDVLDRVEAYQRQQLSGRPANTLGRLNEMKSRSRGAPLVSVHEDVNHPQVKRAMAQYEARSKMAQLIKSGRVPGAPAPQS